MLLAYTTARRSCRRREFIGLLTPGMLFHFDMDSISRLDETMFSAKYAVYRDPRLSSQVQVDGRTTNFGLVDARDLIG